MKVFEKRDGTFFNEHSSSKPNIFDEKIIVKIMEPRTAWIHAPVRASAIINGFYWSGCRAVRLFRSKFGPNFKNFSWDRTALLIEFRTLTSDQHFNHWSALNHIWTALNRIWPHSNRIEPHFNRIEPHWTAFEPHWTAFKPHWTAFEPHLTAFEPHWTAFDRIWTALNRI